MAQTPSWIKPAELAKEIHSLRKRLCMLEGLAKEYEIALDAEEAPAAPAKPGPGRPKVSRQKRGPRGAIRGGVADILTETGKPMHANDLLAALQERGVKVGGLDPKISLSRSLYAGPQFVNVGGNTWKLK